jgi:hypothetical protein
MVINGRTLPNERIVCIGQNNVLAFVSQRIINHDCSVYESVHTTEAHSHSGLLPFRDHKNRSLRTHSGRSRIDQIIMHRLEQHNDEPWRWPLSVRPMVP